MNPTRWGVISATSGGGSPGLRPSAGVIHRDVKPANVLMDGDRNRQAVLKLVHDFWVKGMLKRLLHYPTYSGLPHID